METILTKAIKAGTATAEAKIGEYCGEPVLYLYIEGREKGCWSLHNVVLDLPKPIKGSDGITYRYALQGILALTDDEAGAVRSAVVAAKATHAATPQAMARKLRSERQSLCDAHAGALDAMDEHRERCFQGDIGFHGMEPYQAKIDAAVAAIAAFDADHPEVIAAINAERKAQTERFLAID